MRIVSEVVTDVKTGETSVVERDMTIFEYAALAEAEVHAAIAAFESSLTAGVSIGERLSWYKKEQIARDFISGNVDVPSMIEAEASETGEAIQDLALAIIKKGELFSSAAGFVAGIRRSVRDSIAGAKTLGEVEAVKNSALAKLASFAGA